MRILFLVPDRGLSGGKRVVAAHARQLVAASHAVVVAHAGKTQGLWFRVRQCWEQFRDRSLDQFDDARVPMLELRRWSIEQLPDADVTVAVSPETAALLPDLPARCGRRYFLMQGLETTAHDQQQTHAALAADENSRVIVVSNWLAEQVREMTGQGPVAVVPNAVDHDVFYPPASTTRQNCIGFVHANRPGKGSGDALAAIEHVREQHPELRVVMFGGNPPQRTLPRDSRFYLRPASRRLASIYGQCDVWLCPSHSEGFCLPALEAMACGCAVIAADSGGVREVVLDGETGILVPPANVDTLANQLAALYDDPSQLAALADRGRQHALTFSWKTSAAALAKALSV